MKTHDSYETPDGQEIVLTRDMARGTWEVGCWNEDGSCHWLKSGLTEGQAQEKFVRWQK